MVSFEQIKYKWLNSSGYFDIQEVVCITFIENVELFYKNNVNYMVYIKAVLIEIS